MIPLMNVTRELENYGSELGDAVLKVLNSGQYILGPEVAEFEKKFAEFCGARYAIGVGNGTDALVIALRALCIGKEDEVIVPAMSFFATAEAVAAVGATPVFVDVNKESYVISYIHEYKNVKATRELPDFHNTASINSSNQLKEWKHNSNNITNDYINNLSKPLNGFNVITIPIIGSDGKDYSINISYYKP